MTYDILMILAWIAVGYASWHVGGRLRIACRNWTYRKITGKEWDE